MNQLICLEYSGFHAVVNGIDIIVGGNRRGSDNGRMNSNTSTAMGTATAMAALNAHGHRNGNGNGYKNGNGHRNRNGNGNGSEHLGRNGKTIQG